jgi:hypothetical protein
MKDKELEEKNSLLYRRLKNIKREKRRLLKKIREQNELINKLQDELNNALKDNEWINISSINNT